MAQSLFGAIGDYVQAQEAKRLQTRFRRRQRAAIQAARAEADRVVERVTSGKLFSQAQEFLENTFGDPSQSPLVQDFQKQLQVAQSARGLFFGGAPAQAEAGGLAVAGQRMRQELLPSIQSFAFAPETLRSQILAREAPIQISARTGAPLPGITPPAMISPFAAAAQGFARGLSADLQTFSSFAGPLMGKPGAGAQASQDQGPNMTERELSRESRGSGWFD